MKTSNVLASVLFGSMAAAVPLQKRAMATMTHTVVETVVVYTTVWEGEGSQAEATSAPGLFYEHHDQPSSAAASSTAPAYTPPADTPSVAPEPSSVYTPPAPSSPSPEPTPSSVYTPPAVSTPSPAPEPSSVYTPPAPASSAAAAPSPSAASEGSGSGYTNTGGSITMNYFGGGTGSCGKPIPDDSIMVALATDLMGAMTYDQATGNPTNKWCGQRIEITYNGNTAEAVIEDACSGCTNGGLDLPPSLWETLTGGAGGASGDRLQGASWKTI
ncbi:hypothetical protein BU26DRAFT_513195 [Trematosphaeria pertusa]|uniref:RlpA-like protein double-psi beta-barrel domain-containing protein n=1 Tax=Trematosphaeria pertusa TaxID=390896 RepID=A0A6A6J2D1_9PLEO|nr:uncharacterized protein BU26DRAFT_513195 [Trematosphaeria pertusa]KAF2256362.1 hypothetical protein BU26DRAFT_513195 [Trematosphaeria pertusa]